MRYIKLVEGVVGGFMPATHQLRVGLHQSTADAPAHLHVERHTGGKEYTTATATVPAAEAHALLDRVASLVDSLPIESTPGASDDLYERNTRLAVGHVADIKDDVDSIARAWFCDRDRDMLQRGGLEEVKVWQNVPPTACQRGPNKIVPTDAQRQAFDEAVAAVISVVDKYAPAPAEDA
ncbi:hypothetical protein AMAG_14800 [Allomyces macrogynus ATCC 38327]|uniref:Uncharacterized protein n=1 Tax=Allomyces macrogynus (strain ATCC 38327) TaxID=578462 RepID=A0A0L0T5B2_ALLM3|nr:hypothetical protein AMAG_14800 [Allomyces macrogynus ATCC 38327]|eukprot:KNE69963.1 hypothetical protein AMAG_14800 [Allomyces macrogynus ATCC 38327]